MATLISSNFSELLYPGLKAIWGMAYKEKPEIYSKIFNVQSSSQAYEKTLSMTGFGAAATKSEGTSVTYDDAYEGLTQTLTHVTKGLGFIVAKELMEDDQYGKINALPKALAFSIRSTIEQDAANVLNNAFSTSYTGADGCCLCYASHTLLDGGTEQNTLSTAADLSMTSLEQAFIDIGDLVNDRGLLINVMARKLVIPSELEWTAKQLLGSEKDPETNYNAINPAKGIFPEGYLVNPYLTDPDAWFILTDAPQGLVFYWRRKPEFTKDVDFDSDNGKFKSTYRCIQGWDDWRGVFGSPGA